MFWDYQPLIMGIRPQNMPQTSNSLLSPTKSMVAMGNAYLLRVPRPHTPSAYLLCIPPPHTPSVYPLRIPPLHTPSAYPLHVPPPCALSAYPSAYPLHVPPLHTPSAYPLCVPPLHIPSAYPPCTPSAYPLCVPLHVPPPHTPSAYPPPHTPSTYPSAYPFCIPPPHTPSAYPLRVPEWIWLVNVPTTANQITGIEKANYHKILIFFPTTSLKSLHAARIDQLADSNEPAITRHRKPRVETGFCFSVFLGCMSYKFSNGNLHWSLHTNVSAGDLQLILCCLKFTDSFTKVRWKLLEFNLQMIVHACYVHLRFVHKSASMGS